MPEKEFVEPLEKWREGPRDFGTSGAGGGTDPAGTTNKWSFDPRDYYKWVTENSKRPDYSYFASRGPDSHHKPPFWLETKDVAINGDPLTVEEKQNPSLWDRRYRKELHVGQLIQDNRKKIRTEEIQDLYGLAMQIQRWIGTEKPIETDPKKLAVVGVQNLKEEQERDALRHMMRNKPGAAWETFLHAVESGKPLAIVAEQYRTSIDFYGVDAFLDSPFSLAWGGTKMGILLGVFQGFGRTMQVVNVDAQYLRASGVGVLSLLNVSVLAASLKWGGNFGVACLAFCAGDQLTSAVKRRVLQPHDAKGRTLVNFQVGMATAFMCAGVLPWWVLNDVRLAARLALSGAFIGGFVGTMVGLTLERMVALNISRLSASPRELRRFEALMARQKFLYAQKSDYTPAVSSLLT